jgi:hypothetical protein
MKPLTKVVVAGAVVVGLAALIGAPQDTWTPRPAPAVATSKPGEIYCAGLYRDMGQAVVAAMDDLDDRERGARLDRLSRQYAKDCKSVGQ